MGKSQYVKEWLTMDIKEYQQVKDYTYLEYCDYL